MEPETLEFEDLYYAYISCRKRKSNTDSHIEFENNLIQNLMSLLKQINSGNYLLLPSNVFVDGSPLREIFAANFRDRIVQHLVYLELNPIIEKHLIYDCCSCRIGKGTDFAIKRVYGFMASVSNNFSVDVYALKMDLSGFFMTIPIERLLNKVYTLIDFEYRGKYPNLLKYLCKVIILSDPTLNCVFRSPKNKWDSLPDRKSLFKAEDGKGLAIGNITSQVFANLDLADLDHYIKHDLKIKCYSRYVDDLVVISTSREYLENVKSSIIAKVTELDYTVSLNKTYIVNVSNNGLIYLGKIIRPYVIYPRNSSVNSMYKRFRGYGDSERSARSVLSQQGTLRNYNGIKLMYHLYQELDQGLKFRLAPLNYKLKPLPSYVHDTML